jgi:teichuronic acid biosynthesis glycosyltransferase TuaG
MSESRLQAGKKFSVVIPTYNAEQTIARALDSVLGQSYPAHEIIVTDDASTDKTMAALGAYGDRVKVIQKIANSGGSVARNTGMAAASGDYIAFLDADDVWHRDKLALVNTILSSNRHIRLFYHPYTQENILAKKLPEQIGLFKLPFVKLLPANVIATSCAVISNDPSFRFDPSMRYTEDYDLWLRIGYKYKIYFVNIPLTQVFRPFTSKGGVSEKRWKMRRGEMKAYRHLLSLNPLFAFLLPFLWLSSVGKYLYKLVRPAA